MEYQIANFNCIFELQSIVERLMKEGWAPTGGMTATTEEAVVGYGVTGDQISQTVHTFYQAMTRPCKPAKTAKKSSLQPKAVIDLWNKIVADTPLPRKLKIIPSLEQTIRKRINEKDGFSTIEEWDSYFCAITRSDFLAGKTSSGDWKASLDWAIRASSIVKVIEGRYHNGKI